jgi:hypothetical protein
MIPLVLIAAGAFAAGAVVGRWRVAIVVSSGWALFVLGLERGWWGSGVGDGWVWMLGAGIAVVAAAAAVGVAAHRAGAGRASRPSASRFD